MKKKINTTCLAIFAALGLLGTIIFRWGIVSTVIRSELEKKIRLEPGTELWNIWKDIPIPIYLKIYFFNVTNPEQILKGGKPKLYEMGPYVYEEKRTKIILNVNDEQVKYRPKTIYHFRPDLSYGSDEDNVTTLNVPFVGVARMAWDIAREPMILSALDGMLSEKGETIFHTNKVREFLFDGFSIENYMDFLTLPITEAFGGSIKIPERILDGKFGFFDDKNGTADTVWVVGTGKDNPENFGKVLSVNGKSKMDVWKGDFCNKIDGTDGTIFPPFGNKDKILNAYSADMCRSVQMQYVGPGEFMGIPTLKYTFMPNLYGSLNDFPEKICYCKGYEDYCKKGGVLPVGPCIGGAPAFVSQPHFMGAHKSFSEGIIGLNPSGDYRSIVDVEPNIGLPLRGTMRMQINIELQKYDHMDSFENVPKVLFPILHAEETATVTEELAAPIKILVIFIRYLDILVGLSILFWSGCLFVAIIMEACYSNLHLKILNKM